MPNDLIIAQNLTTAIFDDKQTLQEIVEEVREAVADFEPDISTPTGRKAIASFAAKIAKTKTGIDSLGKEKKEEYKKHTDTIDSLRKYVRDTLDQLRDLARKPLTDFENLEKVRIEMHESNVVILSRYASSVQEDLVSIEQAISDIKEFYKDKDWQEFAGNADLIYNESLVALTNKLESQKRYKQQQEELLEFRRKEEERLSESHKKEELLKQERREEDIRIEAETRAKKEAEEQIKKAEQAAIAAEQQAALEIKRAAEREARAAEQVAHEVIVLRNKIEAEQKAAQAETLKRESDLAHKGKIHSEVLLAIQAAGLDSDTAKAVVRLIVTKKIPHLTINY